MLGSSHERPSLPVPAPGQRPGAAVESEWYQTRDVVDLLGVSRRQLQYWAKTGLVEPSDRTAVRVEDVIRNEFTRWLENGENVEEDDADV